MIVSTSHRVCTMKNIDFTDFFNVFLSGATILVGFFSGIENIPFFRCGTEYIDLLLIRAVGIQAGAELEIGSIVRTQLAAVRGTVGTFASGDHMVHGVLNMAQGFVSLVAHLASPRFSSGAIRSL